MCRIIPNLWLLFVWQQAKQINDKAFEYVTSLKEYIDSRNRLIINH